MLCFQVEPFASLATLSSASVPRLLLNRELVGPFKHRQKRPTDVARTGELGESLEELVRSAGWEKDLRVLQGKGQEEKGEGESETSIKPILEKGRGVKDLEVRFSELTLKDGVEGSSDKKVGSEKSQDVKEGTSEEDKSTFPGKHDNKVEDKGEGGHARSIELEELDEDNDDRDGKHKHWRLQPWKNKPD